jgi:hypothetical protein
MNDKYRNDPNLLLIFLRAARPMRFMLLMAAAMIASLIFGVHIGKTSERSRWPDGLWVRVDRYGKYYYATHSNCRDANFDGFQVVIMPEEHNVRKIVPEYFLPGALFGP